MKPVFDSQGLLVRLLKSLFGPLSVFSMNIHHWNVINMMENNIRFINVLTSGLHSQNPPAAPLSDPPQIYLTNMGDPSALITLGGGTVSPVPSPHVSMGTQGPQQEDCGSLTNPTNFPSHHPHAAPHQSHPAPVFVIINPPPNQQQQQVPMTTAAPPPSVALPPTARPPPIVIKEENLPSEQELLEMVTLDGKQVEEVRGGGNFGFLIKV